VRERERERAGTVLSKSERREEREGEGEKGRGGEILSTVCSPFRLIQLLLNCVCSAAVKSIREHSLLPRDRTVRYFKLETAGDSYKSLEM